MWRFRSRNNTDLLITDNAVTTKQNETKSGNVTYRIDGLVQERRNFSALVFLAQTHRYEIHCTVAGCVARMRFYTNILMWRHKWRDSVMTILTIVYSAVYSDVYQRKHQSPVSRAFVWGIHRWPVNSPHHWPETRKMFPFDDVIMNAVWSVSITPLYQHQSLLPININHLFQCNSCLSHKSINMNHPPNQYQPPEHLLLWMLQTNVVTSIV